MTGPSGDHREVEISAGPYRAVVTHTGATLREVRHGSTHLLDGFAPGHPPDGCRGQVLAPWPNRLRDGRWTWNGEELRLPVDEPTKGNSASHGLVRWARWEPLEVATDRVVMAHHLEARPGYPFELELQATYELDDVTGLRATLTARNTGDQPAPVALGAHPYLRPPGDGPVDTSSLTLPATTRVLVDEWGVPVGSEPVAGSAYDFRSARQLDGLAVNHAFTDLGRDDDGATTVELGSAHGPSLRLRAGPTCRWLQVFTGDSLVPGRRRRGVAVEPMTAPPGALASKVGLTVLEPDEELSLWWTLRLVLPTSA